MTEPTYKLADIATCHDVSLGAICRAFGLPEGTVINFQMTARAEDCVELKVTRYATVQELAALHKELDENPPTDRHLINLHHEL